MTPELENVMRRVQKLLAIAQDNRADPNEAAAAAGMAEKLMRKYQLEHVEVMRADFTKRENFDSEDVYVRMKMHNPLPPKLVPAWAQWMAVQLAQLHDCQVRQVQTTDGRGMRFSGYKADAQVCAWTFDYLVSVTIRSVRAFQKERTRSKTESDSYRRGFTLEVSDLLKRARKAKEAEQTVSSASRELVVLKANAVAEHFGGVKYGIKKSSAHIESSAFARGKQDGAKVDVARRAVAGNSTTQARIA